MFSCSVENKDRAKNTQPETLSPLCKNSRLNPTYSQCSVIKEVIPTAYQKNGSKKITTQANNLCEIPNKDNFEPA